jgi:hypothetical protein
MIANLLACVSMITFPPYVGLDEMILGWWLQMQPNAAR